ncbi:immune inhibitor A [bacterium]|nr:immune inhibitor A [bacterium]
MVRQLRFLGAALAVLPLLPAVSAAQPNSTTVDYIVVTPDYECVRISPGGLDEHSASFTALGFNRGPNAVAENQGGDDISLGPVTVTWAMPDSVFDAHSGQKALTESPDGPYGNNWNVAATVTSSISLVGAASASVEFWHHYDLESGWDFGYVEVNSGAGWNVLSNFSGTLGGLGDFTFQSINLTSYLGQTIQLRFRMTSDGSITRDGWVIDDVVVRKDGVPAFSDDFESGLGAWTLPVGSWGLSGVSGLAQLGTISPAGKFTAGGITGSTFVRAIHNGTLEATADIDVYPPSWVP